MDWHDFSDSIREFLVMDRIRVHDKWHSFDTAFGLLSGR